MLQEWVVTLSSIEQRHQVELAHHHFRLRRREPLPGNMQAVFSRKKTGIFLDGFRGGETIAKLSRGGGIAQSICYKWSKEFFETGKRRLASGTAHAASNAFSYNRKLKKTSSLFLKLFVFQ